jgi:hypothetical protein
MVSFCRLFPWLPHEFCGQDLTMLTLFMAALHTEEEHVLMLTLFMAASQTEEEHLLMLQEDERRTQECMSRMMHHIVTNDYTSLKDALIRGSMQICTGISANFTIQMQTDCEGVRFLKFFAITPLSLGTRCSQQNCK